MNKDGMIKVKCKYGVCDIKLPFNCCSKNYVSCNMYRYVTWSFYIINKNHLVVGDKDV